MFSAYGSSRCWDKMNMIKIHGMSSESTKNKSRGVGYMATLAKCLVHSVRISVGTCFEYIYGRIGDEHRRMSGVS